MLHYKKASKCLSWFYIRIVLSNFYLVYFFTNDLVKSFPINIIIFNYAIRSIVSKIIDDAYFNEFSINNWHLKLSQVSTIYIKIS